MTLKDYYKTLNREKKSKLKRLICEALIIDAFQLTRRLSQDKWTPLEKRVLRTTLDANGYEKIKI